jgi:hypothetical protein
MDGGRTWVPPPAGVMLVRVGETTTSGAGVDGAYVHVAQIADLPALIHRAVARR